MNKEKITNILNLIKNSHVCTIAIENFLALLFFVFVGAVFETNDDVGLEFIVSGVYGEPSPYMVHSNYLWGRILSSLYRSVPFVKWYVLLEYVVMYISLCVILYVIDRRIGGEKAKIIKYPMLVVVGYEMYANIQYTKIAVLSSVAGYMLLLLCFDNIINKIEMKRKTLILSFALIIIGSMIRLKAFFVSVPFAGLMILLLVLKNKEEKKEILKCLALVAVLVVILLLTIGIDKYEYLKMPGWEEHRKWDAARTLAIDYKIPEYWEATEEYQKLGLNASDFYMLRGWMFGDTDFFTTELMSEVSRVDYPVEEISIHDRINKVIRVIWERTPERLCVFLLFVLLIYFLMEKRRIIEDIIVLLALAGAVTFFLYFDSLGRMVNRTNVGVWMATIMVIICTFSESKSDDKFSKELIILITGIFFIINLYSYYKSHVDFIAMKDGHKEYKERTLFVADDKDRLYINDIGKNMFEVGWSGVFDKLPCDKNFGNVVDTASWLTNTPTWHEIIQNKGVDNIFRDTLDKDVVYIFTESRIASFETYIHEHYHPEAKFVQFRKFSDGIGYYKLVSDINNHSLDSVDYVETEELNDVYSFVAITDNEDTIWIDGMAYENEESSYHQNVYVIISDKNSERTYSYEAIRKDAPDRGDDMHGKYGDFEITIKKSDLDIKDYNIDVVLLSDGELCPVPINEYNTEVYE